MLNWINLFFGAIGGVIAYIVGGIDSLLIALLVLMIIDYISGLIKAYSTKKLSSQVGMKGILKKFLIVCVVVVSALCETVIGIPAIREIVLMFFVVNECLSIIENACIMGVKIPKKLQKALEQINEEKFNG